MADHVTVTIKKALIKRIDRFLKINDGGYTSRPEVVHAALRRFLDHEEEQVQHRRSSEMDSTAIRDRL